MPNELQNEDCKENDVSSTTMSKKDATSTLGKNKNKKGGNKVSKLAKKFGKSGNNRAKK